MTSLLVPSAFNGPPTSGNGGWSAGALTALLGGSSLGRTVEVTLRLPPPLETELAVVEQHGTWRALDDQERTRISGEVLPPDRRDPR